MFALFFTFPIPIFQSTPKTRKHELILYKLLNVKQLVKKHPIPDHSSNSGTSFFRVFFLIILLKWLGLIKKNYICCSEKKWIIKSFSLTKLNYYESFY